MQETPVQFLGREISRTKDGLPTPGKGRDGLPLWLSWYRIRLQCGRHELDPWFSKIPWRRERLPTPVFWPREFHGLYSPWGHKEQDSHFSLSLFLHFQRQYKDQCNELMGLAVDYLLTSIFLMRYESTHQPRLREAEKMEENLRRVGKASKKMVLKANQKELTGKSGQYYQS